MTYGQPSIGGTLLPLPNAEKATPLGAFVDTVLAGGRTVRYRQGASGLRWQFDLTWNRLTEAQVALVVGLAATIDPVAYVHGDGTAAQCLVTGWPSPEPIAGTAPVRAAVSIQLTELRPH